MAARILQLADYKAPPPQPADAKSRKRIMQRHEALKSERSTWDPHWREIADYLLPRRQRFQQSDRNQGTKRNDKIVNSKPTRALRVLASGMHAGITSPARPWFRLTTPDPDLAEFQPVKEWLHHVAERMREIFARSNWYNALPVFYADLAAFGTSPLFIDEDPQDVLRGYVLPIGSYSLANSPRLTVDTCYRELSMTTAQMVERFGLDACSPLVRDQYRKGNYDAWHDVLQVIEPNRGQEYGRAGPRGMPWKSCWLEKKGDDSLGFLAEGGYEEFPVLAARWNVTGEDVYGTGPGMDALGDIKGLQVLEKRKASAVDKIVNPPMVGPASLRTQRASIVAGDLTIDDSTTGPGFRPAMQIVPASITVVNESIEQHERRIDGDFHADLWLMLANEDRSNVTAREVAERHEEKMLQLGPVLERLQDEVFDPGIDRTFAIMLRRGLIPPPPEEIEGVDLKVELIGILAEAQKLVATTGIERFLTLVGQAAAVWPEAKDKVDIDQTVDAYADALGVRPDLVRSDDAVAELRAQRAQAEQAMAQGQAMLAATEGARNLSQAKLEDDSALTRMLNGLSPVAAATGGGPPV